MHEQERVKAAPFMALAVQFLHLLPFLACCLGKRGSLYKDLFLIVHIALSN